MAIAHEIQSLFNFGYDHQLYCGVHIERLPLKIHIGKHSPFVYGDGADFLGDVSLKHDVGMGGVFGWLGVRFAAWHTFGLSSLLCGIDGVCAACDDVIRQRADVAAGVGGRRSGFVRVSRYVVDIARFGAWRLYLGGYWFIV